MALLETSVAAFESSNKEATNYTENKRYGNGNVSKNVQQLKLILVISLCKQTTYGVFGDFELFDGRKVC